MCRLSCFVIVTVVIVGVLVHTNERRGFVLRLIIAVLRSMLLVICLYCALLWHQLTAGVESLFNACFMHEPCIQKRSQINWGVLPCESHFPSLHLTSAIVREAGHSRQMCGRQAGVGLVVRAHEQLAKCAASK